MTRQTDNTDAPFACSLDEDAFEARLAEIRALANAALLGREQTDDGLRLRFRRGLDIAPALTALIEKEKACCSFLEFELDSDSAEITVTVRGPSEARALLDTIFADNS